MLETHVLEFLLKYLPGGQKKKKKRKKKKRKERKKERNEKKIDQFCMFIRCQRQTK